MNENTEQTIWGRLRDASETIGAVTKDEVNGYYKFRFRGVDAVVNAVAPAFKEHGIVITFDVLTADYEEQRTTQGKTQTVCRVKVRYYFNPTDGTDAASACVVAESADSGDKGTTKAMSVAYRTVLLQVLCLPTDDPDPDQHTYERVATHSDKEVEELINSATTLSELRELWDEASEHDMRPLILAKRNTIEDETTPADPGDSPATEPSQ